MKRVILKNWMAAVLLAGACSGLVACDDDNDGAPEEPSVAAVQGKYSGTMAIGQAVAPTAAETPAATALNAVVTADKIQFEDFPIRDLVIQVIGDETLADQIVSQVGKVTYEVPYTAQMSEDKATVKLTLTPGNLKLTLSENGNEATLAETEPTQIEVTITTEKEGTYTFASKKLGFNLSATSVKLGGEELPGFKALSLNFGLTKK